MKKEDVISLLVYIFMLAVAFVVGKFVVSDAVANLSLTTGKAVLMVFAVVIISVIIIAAVIEIAHISGARMGGYEVTSVNVLGFSWRKINGKWKFKFSGFDGLTGETKITPKKEDASPKPFALFPLFVCLLIIALGIAGYFIFQHLYRTTPTQEKFGIKKLYSVLSIFLLLLATLCGMIEVYNIFPAKLDTMTDGYRLLIASNKENVKAFNELNRIENAYQSNIELTDMKTFDTITDFTTQTNMYSVYKYLKEERFDEAEAILDKIIQARNKINKANYCSALAQKMYILLMARDFVLAQKYYTENVTQEYKRFIANDCSMQSIRAYILISSMLDISEHEVRFAIGRKQKALKNTLQGRKEVEESLYAKALDKVDQVRPEWHIKEAKVGN